MSKTSEYRALRDDGYRAADAWRIVAAVMEGHETGFLPAYSDVGAQGVRWEGQTYSVELWDDPEGWDVFEGLEEQTTDAVEDYVGLTVKSVDGTMRADLGGIGIDWRCWTARLASDAFLFGIFEELTAEIVGQAEERDGMTAGAVFASIGA